MGRKHARTALIQAASRTALVAVLAVLSPLGASASAQSAQPSRSQNAIAFNIPGQPLSASLTEYARQAGVSVLFPYDRLQRIEAPALQGSYAREDALRHLLEGSGFEAALEGPGVVRLRETRRPQGWRAEEQRATDESVSTADRGGETNPSRADEEIVVTGTRIRGAPPAGANVITLDRDYIDQSGQNSLIGVMQTLPQNFSGSQNEVTQNSTTIPGRNIAFASTVDLRGIGADATLTLVNGRRLAPAGFGNFVDVSAVPLAAVERVEVLADGASAIYGSDAVGGVVNIILRSNFDGQELAVHYGDVTDGGGADYGASAVIGRSWLSGSIIAGYEHRRRDALANADRDFAADSDLRAFGGHNFSNNQGHPGTIIRIGATPVTLAIPRGQDGTSLQASELIVGQTNFRNGQEDGDLLPQQDTDSVFVSLRQEILPDLEIYVDALASDRQAHAFDTQLAANLVVPESNYYRQLNNLFPGQGNLTIAYSFEDDLGPSEYAASAKTFSGITGFRLTLPHDWRLDASLAYGDHQDESVFFNVFDPTGLNAALASNNPATAFNPFSDGGNSNPNLLAALRLRQATTNDSILTAYALKADGELFDLPGGPVRAAIGVERRVERFSIERLNTFGSGAQVVSPTQAPGRRTTDAAFAEILLPLVGAEQNLPLLHRLDLSLSVREEHSDDYGTATTPKVGVTWGVSPNVSVRATWGRSFKAPQFQQTLAGIFGTIAVAPPFIDPFATNGSTGVLLLTGSNPDLEPEEAESWTAGLHYQSETARGLRLSATYFDIDFANRISTPTDLITAIHNPGAFAPYLIRNPSAQQIAHYLALPQQTIGSIPPDGIELIFDSRLTNLSSLRVRGIDLEASEVVHFDFGDVTLSAAASNLLQYTRRASAAAPSLEVLDTLFNPIDWHGRLSLGWSNGGWSAQATLAYVDNYQNLQTSPHAEVASFTTLDLRFARLWSSGTSEDDSLEASLSIQNLLDQDPPFTDTPIGIGFDAANASPMGRFVSLQVRKRW